MGFIFVFVAIAIVLYLGVAVLNIGTGIQDHWPSQIWRGGVMILILVLWWITHQNRPFRYKK